MDSVGRAGAHPERRQGRSIQHRCRGQRCGRLRLARDPSDDAAVADFLRPMGIGQVKRYEIPGLHSFNFVVDHALAGGASRSLRLDTQGKALGVVLLEMKIPAPAGSTLPQLRRSPTK